VKHLLIVGGHTIHSAAVLHLIRQGAIISFFEADGTPAGTVRPPIGQNHPKELSNIQRTIPRQRFATALAKASVQARLFLMEREEQQKNSSLFYEGELEFLRKSRDEFAFLIKLEEIRRLHRLVLDMYYEIMARSLPPDLGFRRRGTRPYMDPVNTMLSFGHALLFGNCTVAALGAELDPDSGFLYDGKNGLIHDIADPFRPGMVDAVIFAMAEKNLNDDDYELTPGRCILSDTIIREITRQLHTSIQAEIINHQVSGFADAIQNGNEFTVTY